MPKGDATKFLEEQLKKWDTLSAADKAKAEALLTQAGLNAQEIINSGGLTEFQKTSLSRLDDFVDANGGYNPAISVGTDILSGRNPQQEILTNASNQWNGWALNPQNSSPGMNAPLQNLQDRGFEITNTQGRAGLNELVDAQKTYGDVIAAGGMTGDLKSLLSLGKSMVASGGFTPELMGFLNQASSQIMQFGEMTPEMRRVFNSAMEIVDAGGEGGALLPTEQIISFARDEATARGQDQFAAAQRAAVQRGMTPGAVTGVGGDFAEFADQIGQGEAKAIRDASLGAQEQRLQQFLASQGTAGQIASANASQRAGVASGLGSLNGGALSYAGNYVNAGAGLAQTAANAATNMYGASVTGMNNASQIFLDREKMGGDWLLGANDAARSNVAFGSDLARSTLGTQLDGISLFNQSQGGANNDILNALGLGNNISQGGINNTLNAGNQLINIGGQYMTQAQIQQQYAQMTAAQRAEMLNQPGFWGELARYGAKAGINLATGGIAGGLEGLWGTPTRQANVARTPTFVNPPSNNDWF